MRTIPEIQARFLEDIGKLMGQKITFPKWDTNDVDLAAASATANPTPPKASAPVVASLGDHASQIWLAEQHGFTVGRQVMNKLLLPRERTAESLFVIFSIQSNGTVTLKQVISFDNKLNELQTSVESLISEWSIK